MTHYRMIGLLASVALITACSMPDFVYSGSNGKVTLNGDLMTLHVDGTPDATIGSSGDWTVDSKAETLSAPQRGLLMMYYQSVQDIREQSVNMGKTGATESVKAIKDSINGTPDKNEKQKIRDEVEAQVHQLTVKMCQDEVNLSTIQDQLAEQLPSFKPYGSLFDKRSVDKCVKDDND